ncbi:MAG: PrsW family intramembrane metalloprotease, partial [Firmicutes bacterium]|nr:PrsW family intramembrane metalloprotease [Bacillota bacterium]
MSTGLMFLALIPGFLIVFYVYRKDTVEKEPTRLIVKLIILGAVSCIPAMFLETFMDQFIPQSSQLAYAMGNAFMSAALCEEICKFGLLYIGSWRSKFFDYRFDGIVYGVSVAVGFALCENLMYVAEGGFYVALMRGVLAVPLHAFCGAFMGMFYGAMMKNRVQGNSGKVFTCLIGALIVPMMIHGIYDTLAFMGDGISTILLLAFVLFMYIIAIKFVNKFSKEDWNAGFYKNGRPAENVSGTEANGGSAYTYGGFYGDHTLDDFKLYHGDDGRPKSAPGTLIIKCPNCGGALRVPSGAGRVKVTCS